MCETNIMIYRCVKLLHRTVYILIEIKHAGYAWIISWLRWLCSAIEYMLCIVCHSIHRADYVERMGIWSMSMNKNIDNDNNNSNCSANLSNRCWNIRQLNCMVTNVHYKPCSIEAFQTTDKGNKQLSNCAWKKRCIFSL